MTLGNMNELLDKLIDRTADWLKYAEAKNAAMVAYIGVMISMFSNFYDNCCIKIAFISLFGALMFALLSFFPVERSKPNNKCNTDFDIEKFNIFAWPDLAKITPEQLLDYLQGHRTSTHGGSDSPSHSIDETLLMKQINQVIVLAQITAHKDFMFKCALGLSLIGTAIIMFFMLSF